MSSRFLVVPSLWLVFFVNGAVLSSWAPRILEVKDRLALSDSEFGLALLGIALGSVPAMLLITCLLRRVSDIAVCSSATLLFPTALLLRRDFHADPALAASVLSMFSIAMFISRSISDTIMHHVRESTFFLFTAIIIALTIRGLCHGISSLGYDWHRGDGLLRRTSVSARLGAWWSRRAETSAGGRGCAQHHWLRRAPWGTAADRFRRRAHQPDLYCCRRRRHCCGSAGQRSKGA